MDVHLIVTIMSPTNIPKAHVWHGGPILDSLRPDLLVVAESGGTLISSDHPACDSSRIISKHEGVGGEDRFLGPALQPVAAAVRLDCNDRFPRTSGTRH